MVFRGFGSNTTEDLLLRWLEIAPVYTQNAVGRYVYLPEEMMMVRMKSLEEEVKSTSDIPSDRYEWIGFAEEKAEYVWYEDDGISKNYLRKETWRKVVKSRFT